MAKPTTRNELKEYGLRKLGKPVISINIDASQVDDAVDDALEFVAEYHYDFRERTYLAIQVTQQDITNGYLTLPEGVQDVFSVTNYQNNLDAGDSLFSVKYQLRLNDMFNISSMSLQYYFASMQYIALLDDILNPDIRYEFNRYVGRLYLNFNWKEEIAAGTFVIVEVSRNTDMTEPSTLWGHWVMRDVFTEMLRIRWGDNLSKFAEIQLPGGVTLNGERIVQEGKERLEQLRQNFQTRFSEPTDFIVR